MTLRKGVPQIGTGDDPGKRGKAVGEQSYLIRYGVMSHVGRFSALRVRDICLERGQRVVLQTDRGLELGEVLIAIAGTSAPAPEGRSDTGPGSGDEDRAPSVSTESSRVLRAAGPDDLLRSRRAEESRPSRFSLCQRILQAANWPWELIDVEPLLDGRTTVIHYLGPRQIDVAPLRAQFRVECDIDVVLEPVGTDPESDDSETDAHDDTNNGCGSCGCGEGGGCGTAPAAAALSHDHHAEPAVTGCTPKSHSGCSSCGISRLLAERSRARA